MSKKLDDLAKASATAVNWLYNIAHQNSFNGDRAYLRDVAKHLRDATDAVCRKPPKPRAKPRYCYQIIGRLTRKVIGHCWGDDGKREVLAEEPGSSFRRISARKFKAWEKRYGEFGERQKP